MTIQQYFRSIKENLTHSQVPLQKIADDTDIHYNTLLRIRDGKLDNPKLHTLEKLGEYFDQSQHHPQPQPQPHQPHQPHQ